MPRAAVCRYSGRPSATPASTRACTCFHCSPPGSRCSQVIDSGRPLARASCSTRSNSASKRSRPAHQVEIADHLHHAVLQPVEGADDAGQLGGVGLAGRGVLARGGAVVVAASGGKAGRAGLQRLAHQRAHGGDVLGRGGWRRPARARPSPPCAPGRAAPAPGSPGCAACASSASMYCGKLSQSKRTPSASATPGMSSTPSIRSIRSACLALAQRREADAAVAHHQRGHAMVDAGREGLVPAGLAVVVGVDVDEAGREPGAGGVDALVRGAGDAAHLDDAAVLHADVGADRAARPCHRPPWRLRSANRAWFFLPRQVQSLALRAAS